MTEETGELAAKIGGQEVSLKGVSINTIATVLTLLLVILVGYVLYAHQQDTRDASVAFVGALKEQTVAIKEQTVVAREQNCLISMPAAQRDPELCRRLSK